MTLASTPAQATPGFATMVTPLPPTDERSAGSTAMHWISGGVQILFVGALVPLAILLVGAPLAFVVGAIVNLLSR